MINSSKTLNYFSANISGQYGSDYMHLDNIKVKQQFIIANQCNGFILTNGVTGIMGFDNIQYVNNIFDNAYADAQIVSPIFALQFGNQILKQKSYLYYNLTKNDFYQFIFVKSYHTRFWTIPVQRMLVQNSQYTIGYAMIDTGTSITILPKLVFMNIFQKYFKDKCEYGDYKIMYTCKCQQIVTYPNITIEVNSRLSLNITPQMYLSKQQNGKCFLHIDSVGYQPIIGMNVLQHFTLVFDKLNNQIGFKLNEKKIQQYIKNEIIINIFQLIIVSILLIFVVHFRIYINKKGQLVMSKQSFQLHASTQMDQNYNK